MFRISLDSPITKDTSKVIDRAVEGETLVIHLPSGNYFSLNLVGTQDLGKHRRQTNRA